MANDSKDFQCETSDDTVQPSDAQVTSEESTKSAATLAMNCPNSTESESKCNPANEWATTLLSEANTADNLTLGIVNGSRLPNDRRTFDRIMQSVTSALQTTGKRALVIHLDATTVESKEPPTSPENRRIPVAERSPLGNWSEVNIPILGRSKATWELEQLPTWLPVWKDAFQVIVLDLGPMHLPESRAVGRLCDGCYVLLGPDACGSSEWIMQQAAWHHKVGSIITGTLVSSLSKAA